MKWRIWNIRDKCWVGKPYSNVQRARHRADKLDLAYGAINYSVRAVQS